MSYSDFLLPIKKLFMQDDTSASNGNRDPLSFDGMADAEVERRLKVTC